MPTISERITAATVGLEQALTDAGGATGLGEIRQTRAQLAALDLSTRLDRTYIETETGARVHVVDDSGTNKYRYTGLVFATTAEADTFLSTISSKIASNQICFVRENGKIYRLSGASWVELQDTVIAEIQAQLVALELYIDNKIDGVVSELETDFAEVGLGNVPDEAVIDRHLSAAIRAQLSSRDTTVVGLWDPSTETFPVDTTGTMTEYEADVSAWRIITTHEWGAVTYTSTGLLIWNGGVVGDVTDWTYVEPPPFDVSQIPSGTILLEQLEEYIRNLMQPGVRLDLAHAWTDGSDRVAMLINKLGEVGISKFTTETINVITQNLADVLNDPDYVFQLLGVVSFEKGSGRSDRLHSWQDANGREAAYIDPLGRSYHKHVPDSITADEIGDEAIQDRHLSISAKASGLPAVEGRISVPFSGTIATAYSTTTTPDDFAWKRAPDIQTKGMTLSNSTGETILVRRVLPQAKAWHYEGSFADFEAGVTEPNHTGSGWRRGHYWNITGGSRLLALAFDANTGPTDYGLQKYAIVSDAAGLFLRGGWNPNTTDPSTFTDVRDGDFWEVTTAGDFGGVSWEVGDRYMHDGTRVQTNLIFEVADSETLYLPCAASLNEWEIRRSDGSRVTVFPQIEGFIENSVFAIEEAINDEKKIRLYYAFDGKYDPLTSLNTDCSNFQPSFSHDGRRLMFLSNRSGSIERWWVSLEATDAVPQRLTPYRVLPTRDVSVWGDSLANQKYSYIVAALQAMDIANGATARNYKNFGKGSFSEDRVTELMDYYAETVAEEWDKGIRIIHLDDGDDYFNGLKRSALLEHLARTKALGARTLLISMYSWRRDFTWALDTGVWRTENPRLKAAYEYDTGTSTGSADTSYIGATWALRHALELNLGKYFADMWINAIDVMRAVTTSDPDPQFPGLTQLEVVDAFDTFPFAASSGHEQMLAAGIDYDDLTFQGFINTLPGSGSLGDYWRVTGTGITIGADTSDGSSILMHNGTDFVLIKPDGIHYRGEIGHEEVAQKIVEHFTEKGWY